MFGSRKKQELKLKEFITQNWNLIQKTYSDYSSVVWTQHFNPYVVEKLISMRIYLEPKTEKYYLCINTNTIGDKALFRFDGNTFNLIKKEDDNGDPLHGIYMITSLPDGSGTSIEKFNDMDRMSPELGKCIWIQYGYKTN